MSGTPYPNHYLMKKNRLMALQKSNGRCSICGGKADEVHHIDGSKSNHDLDNLLPVCHRCHMTIHSKKNELRWDTEAIKLAMMKEGLDVKDLAEAVGVSSATIYRFLRNGRTKNSTVRKIAKTLGYPVEAFIGADSAHKLEQLQERANQINTIKLVIEDRLRLVEDAKLRRRYHSFITGALKNHFGIRSYYNIPADRTQEAIEFIDQFLASMPWYQELVSNSAD